MAGEGRTRFLIPSPSAPLRGSTPPAGRRISRTSPVLCIRKFRIVQASDVLPPSLPPTPPPMKLAPLPPCSDGGRSAPAVDAGTQALAGLPGVHRAPARGGGRGRLLLPGQPAVRHGDARAPQLPPLQRPGGEEPHLRRAGLALELFPGAPGRPWGGAARLAAGVLAPLGRREAGGAWLPTARVACGLVSW